MFIPSSGISVKILLAKVSRKLNLLPYSNWELYYHIMQSIYIIQLYTNWLEIQYFLNGTCGKSLPDSQDFSCCATLLPVKIRQKFRERKRFQKSCQIFTGKSVAQQLKFWESGRDLSHYAHPNHKNITAHNKFSKASCYGALCDAERLLEVWRPWRIIVAVVIAVVIALLAMLKRARLTGNTNTLPTVIAQRVSVIMFKGV